MYLVLVEESEMVAELFWSNNRPENQPKPFSVAHYNRVQKYQVDVINDLREDKKLLVLDIDYTLFDHRTPAETGAELMRPHLHEFLASAYQVFVQFEDIKVASRFS